MLAAAAAAFGLSHCPSSIIGREAELAALTDVLAFSFADGSAHGLFLSGNPGTGKTLCLQSVCKRAESLRGAVQIWINAALLTQPEHVYQEIHHKLFPRSRRLAPSRAKKALETHFQQPSRSSQRILLVIDEVDHLQSRNDQIFYFLYNTLLSAQHPLLFVSIANSLYFPYTDRVISRLSGITKIEFASYDVDVFTLIIKKRIQELATKHGEVEQMFQGDAAFKLLVGRVMQRGGDIRLALQLTFRVIARAVSEGLLTVPLRIVDQITCPDLNEKTLCNTELTALEYSVLKAIARGETTVGKILASGYGALGIQHPIDTKQAPSIALIERAIARLCTSGLVIREASSEGAWHITEGAELYRSEDVLEANIILD